ncbi:hypothetical protein PI124_g1551 [Phytophthora idaei]|nr:hypothetical protein PI125_g1263 [Phytophthora idaei]KAG3169191.1 hypothetical protein PI126_g2952 [Phytophthora idaei]KAG3253875.1 hypothetical protein PI124_g1551 [Phytophthora idaei]
MLEQTVEESAETVHRSFGKCCNELHFVRTARRRPLPCLVGKKHFKGAAEKQKESFATRPHPRLWLSGYPHFVVCS